MVVVVLFKAGAQVPVIGVVLVELVGKAANAAPLQIGATCVKVGAVPFIAMVKAAVLTHCAVRVGVKV